MDGHNPEHITLDWLDTSYNYKQIFCIEFITNEQVKLVSFPWQGSISRILILAVPLTPRQDWHLFGIFMIGDSDCTGCKLQRFSDSSIADVLAPVLVLFSPKYMVLFWPQYWWSLVPVLVIFWPRYWWCLDHSIGEVLVPVLVVFSPQYWWSLVPVLVMFWSQYWWCFGPSIGDV